MQTELKNGQNGSVGASIGIIVIILLLLAGALYMFVWSNKTQRAIDSENTLESEALNNEAAAIESEISTEFSTLETLEAELELTATTTPVE